MSVAAAAVDTAPAGDALRQHAGPGAAETGLVTLLCVAACVVLTLLMGRDLNWDYFNYHGYAVLQLQQDRLAQDFWAAGVQGYLNPLPFLPLMLMQQAGWHSMLIAATLAALQALNLVFLYLLARHFVAGTPKPRLTAALLTALGAASGAFGSQIGSTFVDATTTPLVMAALWLLVTGKATSTVCIAAALAGAATALKWTNAPFAAGIAVAIAVGAPGLATPLRLRRAALAAAAMSAGFLLLYGYWGWRLYQEHGSALFPLFNQIFRSPDYPAETTAYHRYVPQTLWQLLVLPFAMAEHRAWTYTEVMAPDIRPALLLLLAPAAVAWRLLRRPAAGPATAALPGLRVVLWFFVVSLAGWIVTSSNGRYATPLLLLLGPLLFVALRRLIGAQRAPAACLLVLLLQVFHASVAGSPRWSPQDWTHDWMPSRVPAVLKREPGLFVMVGRPSDSYLAALVHPGSSFVNPIGVVSLRSDGPGWHRFVQMRERFAGRTRVVFNVPPKGSAAQLAGAAAIIDTMIDRLGLHLDATDCVEVVINASDDAIRAPWAASSEQTPPTRHLMACTAGPKPVPDATLLAQRRQAAEIMDAYEARCPRYLAPAGSQVEGNGPMWTRYYGKFDLFMMVDHEHGAILYRQERQIMPIMIGRIAAWRSDVEGFRCALPYDGARGIETLGRVNAAD